MTRKQKALLLRVARWSIVATVSGKPLPTEEMALTDVPHGGLFVTLRNDRALRGCMGSFTASRELVQMTQQVAALSARDPRFECSPITPQELNALTIEISVLSKPVTTQDPLSLELGVHGILIERGHHHGCFLPHVAVEYDWTREEFLNRCCRDKASLPADAWKDSTTVVKLFTAEAFSE